LWKAENYEKFLEERRQLIANEINKFLIELENKETIGEETRVQINWKELIEKGENNFVEFKSSLRFCLREKKPMKYIEHSIAKTINAFLNSEGGRLFIGVDDDGKILGLHYDFSMLENDNSKDSFLLKFDNIIRDYLGKENLTDIKGSFITIDDKEIFAVEVNPSSEPVFMKFENKEEFYVRGSASSQPYSMQEALDYINRHWI
jgi:predicted HTH transcriptional regulator